MVISSNILYFQLLAIGKQIPLGFLSLLAIMKLAWILMIYYFVGSITCIYKLCREKIICCKIYAEKAVGRKKKTFNFLNKYVFRVSQSVILSTFLGQETFKCVLYNSTHFT